MQIDCESALPFATALAELNQNSPPASRAAAAGAGPSVGRVGALLASRGSCQSRRKAGIATCNNRNATTSSRNAAAPFGQRNAAQASNVQPNNRPTGLSPRLEVIPAY